MKDLLLRRAWRNDTFKCVQEAGLSPLGFEWTGEQTDYLNHNYLVSVLKHRATGFYFKFNQDETEIFDCKFSPGSYKLEEQTEPTDSWDMVQDDVKRWLSYLKQELSPDLWERLKEYAPDETFLGTAEISNTPFSYSDAENIIGSLEKLEAQIKENFDLQGDQLTFVKRQIEYLKDAVKRQGRKDWMHTSIGVIVGIAVNLALSPEKAKLLWDLVKSCFAVVLPLPAP